MKKIATKTNAKPEGTYGLKLNPAEFDYLQKIMSSYTDNAKTYAQAGIAALVLPIVFLRQVLGAKENAALDIPWPMMISWALLLLSIGAAFLYQSLAVNFVENEMEGWDSYGGKLGQFRKKIDENPGYVYDLMIFVFYGGMCFFIIGALQARALLNTHQSVLAAIITCAVLFMIYLVLWTEIFD